MIKDGTHSKMQFEVRTFKITTKKQICKLSKKNFLTSFGDQFGAFAKCRLPPKTVLQLMLWDSLTIEENYYWDNVIMGEWCWFLMCKKSGNLVLLWKFISTPLKRFLITQIFVLVVISAITAFRQILQTWLKAVKF